MSVIVYGDFSCAECYLAARRVDVLSAAGLPVDWRAVERAPRLPVVGEPLSGADQGLLRQKFADLDGLLLPGESLPWAVPRLVPKTEAAISAYAEAHGSPVADEVRRLLFELYWCEGADIGNPTVLRTPLAGTMLRAGSAAEPLRESGYAVSVTRGPVTTAAYRRIRSWRDEWQALGSPELPVVQVDGAMETGVDALRRMGKEIAYLGADVNPVLNDPRRYPDVEGRPSAAWISQVGGRWRHIYR